MKSDVRFFGYKHWTLEPIPRCFNVGKGVAGRPECARNRNNKWHAMAERYGVRVEICVGPMTHEEVCAWEVENIALMKTFTRSYHITDDDFGCNFTRGGDGFVGRVQTAEEKSKRRASLRQSYESPELRNQLRVQQKVHWSDETQRQAHVLGITAQANTDETRAKKRIASTTSWQDEVTRRKHIEGNARRWSDPEQRMRHSRALKLAANTSQEKERRSKVMTERWRKHRLKAFRMNAHTWLTQSHKSV